MRLLDIRRERHVRLLLTSLGLMLDCVPPQLFLSQESRAALAGCLSANEFFVAETTQSPESLRFLRVSSSLHYDGCIGPPPRLPASLRRDSRNFVEAYISGVRRALVPEETCFLNTILFGPPCCALDADVTSETFRSIPRNAELVANCGLLSSVDTAELARWSTDVMACLTADPNNSLFVLENSIPLTRSAIFRAAGDLSDLTRMPRHQLADFLEATYRFALALNRSTNIDFKIVERRLFILYLLCQALLMRPESPRADVVLLTWAVCQLLRFPSYPCDLTSAQCLFALRGFLSVSHFCVTHAESGNHESACGAPWYL